MTSPTYLYGPVPNAVFEHEQHIIQTQYSTVAQPVGAETYSTGGHEGDDTTNNNQLI